MKKIIDGKAYNTETATVLAAVDLAGYKVKRLSNGVVELSEKVEDAGRSTLYQGAGGAYFLVRELKIDANANSEILPRAVLSEPGLYPLSRKEALAWAEFHEFDAKKIESMFGEIPEAGMKAGSILLRVPETLKKRMEEAANSKDQSVNAWAMRCLEVCCNRDTLVRALTIVHMDLWALTDEKGRFTTEGYEEIIEHAFEHFGTALIALGIDDFTKEGDSVVLSGDPDIQNWLGREHAHLRTKEWQ